MAKGPALFGGSGVGASAARATKVCVIVVVVLLFGAVAWLLRDPSSGQDNGTSGTYHTDQRMRQRQGAAGVKSVEAFADGNLHRHDSAVRDAALPPADAVVSGDGTGGATLNHRLTGNGLAADAAPHHRLESNPLEGASAGDEASGGTALIDALPVARKPPPPPPKPSAATPMRNGLGSVAANSVLSSPSEAGGGSSSSSSSYSRGTSSIGGGGRPRRGGRVDLPRRRVSLAKESGQVVVVDGAPAYDPDTPGFDGSKRVWAMPEALPTAVDMRQPDAVAAWLAECRAAFGSSSEALNSQQQVKGVVVDAAARQRLFEAGQPDGSLALRFATGIDPEAYRLEADPAFADYFAKTAVKQPITVNAGTPCERQIDPRSDTTRPLSAAFLGRCGGPVTGRAAAMPAATADPMLDCTSSDAAFVVGRWFAQHGGYHPFDPRYEAAVDAAAAKRHVPIYEFYLRTFSDFGCFTSYRGPDDVLVGDWLNYHNDMLRIAIQATTGAVVDVSMVPTFIDFQRARSQRPGGERKKDAAKKEGSDDFPFEATFDFLREHMDKIRRSADVNHREPVPTMAYQRVDGDAVILTHWKNQKYLGIAHQELLTELSRFWMAGVLDLPKITIVGTKPHADLQFHEMQRWIEPFMGSNVRFLWLPQGEGVRVQRPWFVVRTAYEDPEPCRSPFLARYLLPKVLRTVRHDPAFVWGNDTLRFDPAVSDVQWAAASLPKLIAIVKTAENSRNQERAFAFDMASRALIADAGYLWISDATPMHYRLVLVNFADVLLTTFGSIQSMMAGMWAGGDADGPFRPRHRLRIVSLMHPGYFDERTWWAPSVVRIGEQHGIRVVVTDRPAASGRNVWAKLVSVEGNASGGFARVLRREHLQFDGKDCTVDGESATDFTSQTVRSDPMTGAEYVFERMNRSWPLLPKYGGRCPFRTGGGRWL